MTYRRIFAPPWTSMDCRGTTCLTLVWITSCKGRLSAPASGASPPPSFFTDLGVCRFVSFTSSHSFLSTAVSLRFFLPLLKYAIKEALPPLLIGLALARGLSVLKPSTHWLYQTCGKLLTKATPIAPLLPKLCHANP